jgi:glutamyl/glutaminyl-tRNA synthetase
VRLLEEVPAAIDFILLDEFPLDVEALTKVAKNTDAPALLAALASALEGIANWSADAAKATLGEVATQHGTKAGQLMFPLRVALSGRAHGPDLGDLLNLLGQARCVQRVRRLSEELAAKA